MERHAEAAVRVASLMLDQLAGNKPVKDLLKRMLEARRVPAALLLSGEEGIGKKLFALEIAKALNCRTPRGVQACDECASCKRIVRINLPTSDDKDELRRIFWTDHPDVGFVRPPGRVFHVVQMREIEREANYRPFEGAARVFLVDEADKFNDASANALLKILEEPPPTSYIILITSRPAMLLPTIRSRCQVIRFSPLTIDEIEQYLSRYKKLKTAEARLRARLAGGSIARAIASDLEGYQSQRATMLRVLEAAAVEHDRTQLLAVAEELNSPRYKDQYESGLDVLETLIRDAWIIALGASEEQIVNEDLRDQLTAISRIVGSRSPALWLSQIEELREQLAVNINRKVATDALFLSMAMTQ
jgi:DNA polymerase III subunit delta'